jgi:AcrR family transcriptional regulator
MNDEKEIKERILNKATEMFFQFGFLKVTMDEIAAGLGMSKKTLYKFYPGKEYLLKEMFHGLKCEIEEYITELWSDEDMDFVIKLKKLMNFIGSHSSKFRGPLMEDVQKYNPEIWKEVQEFRRKNSQEKFSSLINEGIEKGIFRKDIDQSIIVMTYINAIQAIITPELLSQMPYSANQVFEALGKIIFEGILTNEGRAKYCSTVIQNKANEFTETKSGDLNEYR